MSTTCIPFTFFIYLLTIIYFHQFISTYYSCTVEVIVSSRPGVGKTLAVERHAQKLRQHLGRRAAGENVWVTVPLQTAQVEEDKVVATLLEYQQASYTTTPHIFHIDVAPMVRINGNQLCGIL